MIKKLICISLALILLLTNLITANAAVIEYNFDDNINDNSGKYNCESTSTPVFETGLSGKAISFNDNTKGISIPPQALTSIKNQITISFWQYGSARQPKSGIILHAVKGNKVVFKIQFPLSDGTVYWNAGGDASNIKPALGQIKGRWNHWTFTKNSDTGSMKIYINGVLLNSESNATGIMGAPDKIIIGNQIDGTRSYNGLIDDFRIYDEELDAEAVRELYKGQRATDPVPSDGTNLLKKDANAPFLSWTPAAGAVSHDVYMGTDYNAVNKATKDSPEFKGNQVTNSYKPDIQLDINTTYYWRVDEVSDSGVVKGLVWKCGYNEWKPDVYREWQDETIALIERDLRLPKRDGYYEDNTKSQVSFAWPTSIQLLALSKAAQMNPGKYKEQLVNFVTFTNKYWSQANGIGGYDCVVNPGTTNRFYDDNTWMTWGLLEAYKVTGDESYLERAKEAFKFVLKGEDSTYGGGIWWKETYYSNDPPKCKAVSSTGGGALDAAMLFNITRDKKYLDDALRLLSWLNTYVRDPDGLIMNDVSETGVNRGAQWSYNTAVPMYAYTILYDATKNKEYLDEAISLAKAAQEYFLDKDQGVISDEAYFAFTLAEGWLELYKQTGDLRWLGNTDKALQFIHKYRDVNGRYPKRWDTKAGGALGEWNLLISAAAARIYGAAASIGGSVVPDTEAKENESTSTNEVTTAKEETTAKETSAPNTEKPEENSLKTGTNYIMVLLGIFGFIVLGIFIFILYRRSKFKQL